jgi:argininosuccinate synthase
MIRAALESPHSLYSDELASFGESSYNQADAEGFINLFGLPSQVAAQAGRAF